jgi:hypothetical protein
MPENYPEFKPIHVITHCWNGCGTTVDSATCVADIDYYENGTLKSHWGWHCPICNESMRNHPLFGISAHPWLA